jgi:CRISPR-associated endonuclease/helicase Cas3
MSKQLLAKSPKFIDGQEYNLSLEQHLIDTETAALAIFQGRILSNWCRFFKLKNADDFLLHLRVAALWHDLGKANQEFYLAVTSKGFIPQTLRHEWLSALVLHLPEVRQWLGKSGLNLEVVTAAVLSHHLKAKADEWGIPQNLKDNIEIEFYFDHQEVNGIFAKIAQLLNIDPHIPKLPKKWVKEDIFWQNIYLNVNQTGRRFTRQIKKDDPVKGLLLAVKAGLIASDSVASGIYRTRNSEAIANWVNQTLHRDSITPEEIEGKILQPRYRQVEKSINKPFKLKPFQEKAETLSPRLLLMSGCGSGKTIFAYKWMQGVLKNHQAGRVIFLYPTRGTATEGFKDYVSWCPEADGSLLTGTATYELQAIAENPTEATKGKDYQADERLYALGYWGKRFFSATVDQFLSFLTHNYKSICLLPVLADSVVVIDEIHSFSPEMFESLICFLKTFEIPVLCMTATLPQTRIKDLTSQLDKVKVGLGLEIFPTSDRSELAELEKAEGLERYLIAQTNEEAALELAVKAYQDSKRVLWVVNTVDRCREKAHKLECLLNTEVLIYHSRFKLADRQNCHTETVRAFALNQGSGEKKAAMAVTTQVCEMSLDLDADVLITELAPISSLVQRFGRSNRGGKRDYSEIYVYSPPGNLPYEKEELQQSSKFLGDVLGRASQKFLAEKLKEHSPKGRYADGSAPFVVQGYWASAESFRDIDDFAINAVLTEDLAEIADHIDNKKPIDGFIVPVPKKYKLQDFSDRPPQLPKYLEIADSKFYSSQRGFGDNA